MNRNHGEERWHFDNICYQSGEGLSRVGTKLIIASVLVFVLAIMGEVLIAADNQTKLQNNVSESIDLFKGYDWNDRWGDLSSTGASLTAASNSFILTGHSKNKSYGVIYNDIRINLDDYPEIEIAISDIKGFWFLLVEDQGMPGGYVHLQRDSSSRGVFKYDLKKITGFKRTRNIHLQIGISSGSFSPCDGLFVKIKYLKLNRIHGTKSENTEESGTVSYIPELEKDLRGWQDMYPDGASTGATIDFDEDKGIVRGTSKNINYGFVYRECEVDLNRFPVLSVSVNKVSEGWYLLVYNDDLPEGYVKLERFQSKTGVFQYDLQKTLGWNGSRKFWVALGPVIEKNMIRSNINQIVSFNGIKFQNRIDVRPLNSLMSNQEPDKTNNKLFKISSIDLNAVSTRNSFFAPESFDLKNEGISPRRMPLEAIDFSNFGSSDLMARIPLIFNKFASVEKNPDAAAKTGDFTVSETNDLIILQNSAVVCVFNKKNGSIFRITDRSSGRDIVSDNGSGVLWRLINKDGSALTSGDLPFNYSFEKNSLAFHYGDASSLLVTLVFMPSAKNYVDVKIKISNKSGKDILNFSFPETLTFRYKFLQEFILPFKLGLSLNKNFYVQKKQYSGKYPNLFADFVSIHMEQSALSIYRIPGHDADEMFIPADLDTGYNAYAGGLGFYTHKFGVYIKNGNETGLPVMRFNFKNDIRQTAEDYAKESGIQSSPSLESKLGAELFEKLANSVLLKVEVPKNRDFSYIKSFIKYLSAPTLIHLVTFWEGGFDKNYPDYLPPDEAFGSQYDMVALCKEISGSGNIVMPYTNPTWWHDTSSFIKKMGTAGTAMRDLNGNFLSEYYNNSTGYIMNPFSDSVNEAIDQTTLQFKQEVPCDILFEDQLGARSWLYGSGEDLPVQHAYIQGIINMAKRGSEKMPLFTEEGFDKLVPYETGFCNMSVANALPPDDSFNVQFGKENWLINPLALFWVHDKVAFYQHNLAHEVFADSIKKITWNLVYGHNLNIGRWVSAWPQQIRNYRIADVVQKEIASRCFGKKLVLYKEIDNKVYLSQYEDMMVIGNFSSEEYKIDRYSIAPDGFLAFDKQGTLFAGYFKKFNGETFSTPHMLLMKKKENELLIRQPDAENCFLTLPRPGKWIMDNSIEMFYNDDRIPFVADRKGITCYLRYGQNDGWYRLKYNASKQTGFDLRVSIKRQDGNALVRIEALSFQSFENFQIGVKGYLVNSVGEVPLFIEGKDDFLTQPYQKIKSGEKILCSFPVTFDKQWPSGFSVWLDVSLYSKEKKLKQISSMIRMSDMMDILLGQKTIFLKSDEQKKIPMTIYNYSDKILKGKILCRYPASVTGASDIPFEVEPNDLVIVNSEINAGKVLPERIPPIQYQVMIGSNEQAEAQLNIKPVLQKAFMDIKPFSTLLVNETNRLQLVLADLPENLDSCDISVTTPQDWVVTGLPAGSVDLKGKNYKTIDFAIVPHSVREDFVNYQVSGQDFSLSLRKKCKSFTADQTCLIAGDVNNDQVEDIVLANNKIETTMTPILGGRVLKIVDRKTGNNQLFCDYPGTEISEGSSWQSWTEYGGLNDWWPSGWPGDVWNNRWTYKIVENGKDHLRVEFFSQSADEKMDIIKQIDLWKERNELQFHYEFKNRSDSVVNFFYNAHPDLAPGGDVRADGSGQIIVPLKVKGASARSNTIAYKTYNKSLSKAQYLPGENWCVAWDKKKNEYLGEIFDLDKTDQIGVYQGINFYSMEILSKNFFLNPKQVASYDYWIFVGHDDWKTDLNVLRKSWNIKNSKNRR